MARKKNKLAKQSALARALSVLLYTCRQPKRTIAVETLFSAVPELADGYVGTKDTYRALDRLLQSVEEAGFAFERFSASTDQVFVEARPMPFLTLGIDPEELTSMTRLLVELTPAVGTETEIPSAALVSRDARIASNTVIVELGSRELELVPYAEVFNSGKWYLIGQTEDGHPRTVRLAQDTPVRDGNRHAAVHTFDIPIEQMLQPMEWTSQARRLVWIRAIDKNIRENLQAFASALTDSGPVRSTPGDVTTFEVRTADLTELFRTMLKLREKMGSPVLADDFQSFIAYLKRLIETPEIDGGHTSTPPWPRATNPKTKSVMTRPAEALLEENNLARVSGGASVSALLIRLLACIDVLGKGGATSDELATRTGLAPGQVDALIDTWNQSVSETHSGARLEIKWVSPEKANSIRHYGSVNATELLRAIGRYSVPAGELYALASAALSDPAVEVDESRKELMQKFVATVEETYGLRVVAPDPTTLATQHTIDTIKRCINGKIFVGTPANYSFIYERHVLIPLTEPRQVAGKWVFDAVRESDPDRPVTIQIDSLVIRAAHPAKPHDLPRHHLTRTDIERLRTQTTKPVWVRAESAGDIDYLERFLGAQQVDNFDPEATYKTFRVEVPVPAEESLYDLFVETDGRVQVEYPVELRGEPQRRLESIRNLPRRYSNWSWTD